MPAPRFEPGMSVYKLLHLPTAWTTVVADWLAPGISLYSDSICYVLNIVLGSHISRDYHGNGTTSVLKWDEQSVSQEPLHIGLATTSP